MSDKIKFSNLLELAPALSEHELVKEKGFLILLNNRPKSKTILVESYINNGNVDEEHDNMGISHLLEHVCTDSWKKCGKNCTDLWKKRGAVMNASTGQTYVNYYIHGLNQYCFELLDYIVSISTNPVVTKKTTEKEKAAVVNELLIHTTHPQIEAYQAVNKNLFSVEGLQLQDDVRLQIDNLKNIDHKMLQKWVNKYYGSGNTLFCVTGDLSDSRNNPNGKKKIISFIKKKLKTVKKEKIRPYYKNVFTPGIKIEHVKNTKIDNTTIFFTFHSPLFFKDVEVHYIEFFKLFVNSGMTSLLMYELREKHKLIYNIQFDHYTTPYGTYITIEISTKNKNIKEVIKKTIHILKKLTDGTFPAEHLNYVKKAFLVKSEIQNKNNAWVSTWYADQYINQLNDILYPTIISHTKLLSNIEKMNKGTFVSFVRKLIIFSNLKLIYTGKVKIGNLEKQIIDWID